MPLLIEHRGDTTNHPENTLAAFRSALDKGADGVELDIQLDEGECIVVHDYLHQPGQAYPLLREILDQLVTAKRVEIEVKAFSDDIIPPLQRILESFPADKVELASSVQPLLPLLRQAFPAIKLGAIFPKTIFESWMPEAFVVNYVSSLAKLMGANIAHLPFHLVSKSLTKSLHDRGLLVHTHIARDPLSVQTKKLQQLKAWKVDQCTFDDVNLLKRR